MQHRFALVRPCSIAILFVSFVYVPRLPAVEIIAHRGASHDAPENTIAAFRLGWKQRADAVELDIQLTRDGQIVVIHDGDTKRTTGRSDRVADQTLADLRTLDAGSWKGPAWKGEKLPTLSEALETVPQGKRMFIEIKCGPEVLPVLQQVLAASRKTLKQVTVIGFNYATMKDAKSRLPKVPVYWLANYEADKKTQKRPEIDTLIRKAKAAGLDGLNLESKFPIDAALVAKVKAAGLRLYVWTVDDAALAARLSQAGVDGITTNRPEWLRGQLEVLCPSCAALPKAAEPAASLRVGDGPEHRVEVCLGDRVVLRSPDEGLWSVATAWRDGWPAEWKHARPSRVEHLADWTVVSGRLELPQGVLELRDAFRPESGVIRGVRRFAWLGKGELSQCTLSVRWVAPGAAGARPLLPGVLYYGNPSGARTEFGAVVVHRGNPGDESIVEEHRLSAPWASIEWRDGDVRRSAALHTLGSRVAGGHCADQWWSLGVVARRDAAELTAFSGPCAANGRHSVVKALQRELLPYPGTWMALRPGAIVEKTFFLEACAPAPAGSGFRAPLRTAMRLHSPLSTEGLPTLDRTVRDKYRFACSRFRDRPTDPGFEMFPDDVPGTHYVMGWCGQAEAMGGAFVLLAPRLGDSKAAGMAVRAMNHLATAPFNEHGFLLKYTAERQQWSDQDPVSQGQAMENFARAILAARKAGGIATKPWEDFLLKASTIHAARILRDDWRPVSTAEAFFVSPLCNAYALFGNADFKRAAVKAAEHYAQRHLDMTEPYWGGTLDARCEDKEGALAGFQAFLAVYEMTKEPRYLAWASHALDVALTYTVLWDIDLPPGRLRDHGFKTRGWTIVSAQNQHLDAYGVLFTPEIWRMGQYLEREDLKRLAAVMFRSCGQLIDPFGSQGEQIQQTNFGQSGDMSDLSRLRGGYSEHWTVFWITAHFLNAAAQFEAMGVDLDRTQ